MHKRIFGTWLVPAVAAALLVGACGGGAPAAAPSAAKSAAPTAQPFQGTKVFKVAFTSIGVSSVPLSRVPFSHAVHAGVEPASTWIPPSRTPSAVAAPA